MINNPLFAKRTLRSLGVGGHTSYMVIRSLSAFCLVSLLAISTLCAQEPTRVQIETQYGVLEGLVSSDGKVRTFKGIPYAAPPVGDLRWKSPQPVEPWNGVREAIKYPPRAMQVRVWDDMFFYDDGPSEDCLYLNLWMPAKPDTDKLPVMFWIHGGGFRAGSTSEPRQDGGNLSKKGVLVVSLTYRMGVFGFLAHPELTAESGHNASGNYGLLDMVAALKWVRDNIATFGGDPNNVTIFGESAGSSAVNGLVASPLARGLFHKAIGESSSFLSITQPLKTREVTEQEGLEFAQAAFGTTSLKELRALPAQELLEGSTEGDRHRFRPNIDGWFLPEKIGAIYAAGRQSDVPLLAGWNLDEKGYGDFMKTDEPTVENYVARARAEFGDATDRFLEYYPATTPDEVRQSARDYATEKYNSYEIWKWLEEHAATAQSPVYRYFFEQKLPLAADAPPDTQPRAAHSWEIEYVFGVISSKDLPWRPEDYEVSELMMNYWSNFAKHGDPNGPGLPEWPQYQAKGGYPVMHLDATPGAKPDSHRARLEFLDAHTDQSK